jgi:hypothetical protein
LDGGQLGATTAAPQGVFKTDAGRLVRGGGGIQPDEVVYPKERTRFEVVMEATALLTSFAGNYLRTNDINEDFAVTPMLLDQLQVFLADNNIQPSVGDWLSERDWIASRLQQEFLTLKFGVAKGDEVGIERDPVVQAAIGKLRQ